MGQNEQIVNQQHLLMKQMEAANTDLAYRQKALVGARESEGLIVDKVTGQVFRELSIVLNVATQFTLVVNAVNAWTTVATFTVPNGVTYYFRAVKSEVDRNAPYLFGVLNAAGPVLLTGSVKVRVWDASQNQLKGQPWVGTVRELNDANTASTNWLTRLFFNSRTPVRAENGDVITVELLDAAVIAWGGVSSLFMHVIQLTKQ